MFGFVSLAIVGIYPQEALAEGMKNKDFLELTDDQKKHRIYAMIDTLSLIAVLKNKEQGLCVAKWYYNDTKKKNGLILAYMNKYADSSPSNLLITLTENSCGEYVTET